MVIVVALVIMIHLESSEMAMEVVVEGVDLDPGLGQGLRRIDDRIQDLGRPIFSTII